MAATEGKRRGSDAMLERRGLEPAQLQQLLRVARSGGQLAYWFPKGQPNPESVIGVVRTKPGKAGSLIDKLLALEGYAIRADVFPLGTPVPDEILVTFEHGGEARF